MMRRIAYITLFTITVFQTSCSTLLYETHKDDPILQLDQNYSVRLDSTTWTTKQAQALLNVFKSLSPKLKTSVSIWNISDDELQNDIKIGYQNGMNHVTVSKDVFPIEGYQGILAPDKRLFHVVVQFITENGTNRSAIELILQERYGVSIDITSDVKNQVLMPAYTSKNRTPVNFSEIENEKLMIFIAILEEFPHALHRVPQLKYVVCRDEDLGDDAAAKAWTNSAFIEFKKSYLDGANFNSICKILAHEKSHFLWTHLFPDQLKQHWMELGGWYENKESETGWSTKNDRKGFVTNYAYEKNPNEDMAESLGYYLVYPDKLRACCPAKYDFIHNRIMLMYGKRYIPPDLLN